MAYEAVLQAAFDASKSTETLRKAVEMSRERAKENGGFYGSRQARCIDQKETTGLTEDKVYTVYHSTPRPNMFIVYGNDRDRVESYYKERFELLPEKADVYDSLLALRAAVSGIADDYMTSDTHHPGYVLIPTAKFEEIRAALAALEKGD